MPERCQQCGEVYDDFMDVVFNSQSDHGPFEHIPES
jgi:predicted  nucleic acid-binding Zn-ribbon protein